MATKALSAAESASNRSVVLAVYRNLLRATHLAFRNDTEVLLASRAQARQAFTASSKLPSGSVEASAALEHAQGVTQILRENVVQGTKTGGEGEKYKLRMHEHTQRLDNDVARQLKGTRKSFKDIKNEQF